MTDQDLTKLCEELRLALYRQREANETLVKALEVIVETSVEFNGEFNECLLCGAWSLADPLHVAGCAIARADAALAATKEVKP